MLSTRERLERRQGKDAAPRHEYLQQLVDEYQRTPQLLRKEEIAANLANFAYDPINFGSLARLRVVDLFLDILDADQEEEQAACNSVQEARGGASAEADELAAVKAATVGKKYHLVEFALGGICNCVSDPVLQQQFIDGDGFEIVLPYILHLQPTGQDGSFSSLSSHSLSEVNTVISALTIAYFLLDSSVSASVSTGECGAHLVALQRHPDARIANIAAAIQTRKDELNLDPAVDTNLR